MRLKLTHACTARAPAALVLALGVLAACDSRRSGPVALPTGARTVTYQDSIKLGLVQAHPSVAVTVGKGVALSAADPGAVSIVSLTPSNHQGYDQPATIVGITSGPVGKVTVVGSGAIFCSGSYGTLIGYDSSGTVLGQTPLTLIAPDDCSPPSWPDDVTFGAQATLMVTTGVIAKFEITAMSPLSGPVFRPPDGTYITGNFYQNYSIAVEPAPTPCDSTRNPILADSGVRAVMANALAAGMTDTTYGKRREHGGAIYKFADGHYEAREFLAPDATDCELGDLAISEIVGAVMVAEWHTHPYKVGEKVPQCGTVKFSKPKEVAGVDPKDYTALDDLNAARQALNYPPVIAFVWDRTHVYRYDSTMPKNKRPFRPNPVDHTRTDCTWNP